MGKRLQEGTGIVILALLAGCRSATHVVDVPRVDLELSGAGNRGYLVGAPSTTPELKTERRMVETEIEVPAFRTATGQAPDAELTKVAPPDTAVGAEESSPSADGATPQVFDAYTVKKKETLWSIAANPAVFGDATKWRLIYNANRDLLKSPDRLRAGMTLKIPRGAQPAHPSRRAAAPAQPGEQPTTWTK